MGQPRPDEPRQAFSKSGTQAKEDVPLTGKEAVAIAGVESPPPPPPPLQETQSLVPQAPAPREERARGRRRVPPILSARPDKGGLADVQAPLRLLSQPAEAD